MNSPIGSLVLLLFCAIPHSLTANNNSLESVLSQYCYDCHDDDSQKGDLNLSALNRDLKDQNAFRVWVKVHDAIKLGEMPPKKKKSQPTETEREQSVQWLNHHLLFADQDKLSREGRIRLRRMTRLEYQNSLKDLLALEHLDILDILPEDHETAGFQKIGSGLDWSYAHMERYKKAAKTALDKAVATRSNPPPVFKHRYYYPSRFKFKGELINGDMVLLKDYQLDPALPLRGGLEHINGFIGNHPDFKKDLEARKQLFKHNNLNESQSSVGLLEPNNQSYRPELGFTSVYPGPYRLKISLWSFFWNQGKVEPSPLPGAAVIRAHKDGHEQEGGRLIATYTAPSLQSNVVESLHWLDRLESLIFDPASIPKVQGIRVRQRGGREKNHTGPGIALDWFEFEGPLYSNWPPESHRRLFGNLEIKPYTQSAETHPPYRKKFQEAKAFRAPKLTHLPKAEKNRVLESVHSDQPLQDGKKLLNKFLTRAYRRPVTKADLQPYVELLQLRLQNHDCFEDAMKNTYLAILTSPQFLFHRSSLNENSHNLASRLSYWLWNSPPDDRLLQLANSGTLNKKQTFRIEIERMLKDSRSDRFIADFLDQWLRLNRINETVPDNKLYPEYNFLLHESMLKETREFFKTLILDNLPVTALVKTDFAMLNQALAEHYHVKGVEGVEFRPVTLPENSPRGGLLGQAALMKVTANGTTTSPVTRGVWLIDRLLNQPPPLPPENVGNIDPDIRGATTIREQLQKHRDHPNCAGCHSRMDPPGFALECFDPIGGYREHYRTLGKGLPPKKSEMALRPVYKYGPKVDDSGQFRSGNSFKSYHEFRSLLFKQNKQLAEAFLVQLSRYATGTDVSYADRPVIQKILQKCEQQNYRIRDLMLAMAESPLFKGVSQ